MEEIWKDIVGYEGKYMVSNMGRVKSLNYNGTGKEKILKSCTTKNGYLCVNLYKDGSIKLYKVHRLVLTTFNPVENMENLQVDHINTIRTDNRLDNLRWATNKENCNNPLSKSHYSKAKKGENNPWYGKHHTEEAKRKNGEAHKGEKNYLYGKLGAKHPNSIPVVQLTLDGELVEVYGSTMEAVRKGFNQGNINSCIKGRKKTHGGYKWMTLHEYLHLKYPKITKLNLFGKSYNWKEVNN